MSTYYKDESFKKSVEKLTNKLIIMKNALHSEKWNPQTYLRFWQNSTLKKYIKFGPEVSITTDLNKIGLVMYDMNEEGKTFEESYYKYFLDTNNIRYMVFASNSDITEEECVYCNDGIVDCDTCNGSGQEQCDDCSGEGELECSYCDGDPDSVDGGCDFCNHGTVECESCNGYGESTCYDCDGAEQSTCGECEGGVIVNVLVEFEVDTYLSIDPYIDEILERTNNLGEITEYCESNNINFMYLSSIREDIDVKNQYGWDRDDAEGEIINMGLLIENSVDEEKVMIGTGYGVIDDTDSFTMIKNKFY